MKNIDGNIDKIGAGIVVGLMVFTPKLNADYNSLVRAATNLPKTFEIGSIYGGRMFNTDSLKMLPFSVIDSNYSSSRADSVVADGGGYFAPGFIKAPGILQTEVFDDSAAYWDYNSYGRLPVTGVENGSLENQIKKITKLKIWPNPIKAGQSQGIQTNQNGPIEWYNNIGQKVAKPDGTGIYLVKQNGGVAKVVVVK